MAPTPSRPALFPPPIPYALASSWQQQQALFNACQVLAPAFPYLSPADWRHALVAVDPTLYVVSGQSLLTHEGLAQLTHHLATYVRAAPRLPPAPPPATGRRPTRQAPRRPPPEAIEAGLLAQLTNVSYWRSLPLGQVVNEVLTQGLGHYPDAQRPRPHPSQELF